MQDPFVILKALRPMLSLVTDTIVSGLPPTTTGHGKAQHLGVYFAILALHEIDIPPTVRNICNVVDMAPTHLVKIANRLYSIGVINRSSIHGSHGKGHQFLYTPVVDLPRLARAAAPTPGLAGRFSSDD